MRNEILRYVALASLFLACVHNSLHAQTELQSGSPAAANKQTTEVLEKLPPFILLPDQEGKPSVPFVPTFPLDELNEYLQRSRPRDNPHYVIKSMKLDVVAKTNHAVIQNEITFTVEKGGTTLIPIQMGSVHLSSPRSEVKRDAETNDETAVRENNNAAVRGIHRNNEFGEWELIVNAEKNTEHTVTFESQVRLKRLGNETHLRLQLPRVTDSKMTIRVPLADAHARLLSDGMLSRPVEPNLPAANNETSDDQEEDQEDIEEEQTELGMTEFTIDGLPSEFDFVWYPKSEPPSGDQHSFEVEGDIEVEVDSLGGLTADALLTVTSFNKPVEGLIVKLPVGTRLTDNDVADFGDYEVQAMEADPASPRRQVRVTFAEAGLKPPSVGITVKAEQELSKFELAGFEVLVADDAKQIEPTSESGVVTVVSQGTRRLDVKPGDFARRISDDSDSTRDASAFEYSRPNQIQLLISRQSTELAVEPTYIVEIEESRATLTAIFQCQKRGGNLNSLSFDLGAWDYLEIYRDPEGVVIHDNDDETLEIQLEDAPDSFEVSFRARQQFADSLDIDDSNLLFNFPVPANAQVRQSKVGIITADGIVATTPPSLQAYTKITPTDLFQTAASDLGSNSPLSFLMKAMKAPEDISIAAKKLQARIDVTGDIEITELDIVDDRAVRVSVKETLRWQVRNVALPAAILRMQKPIYENADGVANLQVSIDGVSRLSQDLERRTNYFPSNMVSIRVGLPPQLGTFEMELTYDWLYEDMNPQPISDRRSTPFELPLVLPQRPSKQSEMDIDLQLLTPRTASYAVTLAQSLDPEPWLASADSELVIDTDVEAFLSPSTSTVPTTIPLEIRTIEQSATEAEFDELVDRAWFQTWLTDSTRTDRAVFRVKGGGRDGIRIEMPRANFHKLYAMVDGVPTDCSRDGETIELAVDASSETRVVELRYWLDSREPPGLIENEVPRVLGADILGQWYWHIVMPRNECMVTWPRSLTRAHHWDWSVIFPTQRPQLSLEELEEWSGATITGDQVLAGSTEYLFGAMGETKGLSIRTTLLPIYVLALAGSIFLLGLVLLYYRHRAITLVGVGALIGALIFLHPSYASIAGQVAVFGMLLVLFMTFLRWLANQTAIRRAATSDHDSGFDISPVSRANPGSSVVATATTTLAAGSSRITQP